MIKFFVIRFFLLAVSHILGLETSRLAAKGEVAKGNDVK